MNYELIHEQAVKRSNSKVLQSAKTLICTRNATGRSRAMGCWGNIESRGLAWLGLAQQFLVAFCFPAEFKMLRGSRVTLEAVFKLSVGLFEIELCMITQDCSHGLKEVSNGEGGEAVFYYSAALVSQGHLPLLRI